MINVIMIHLEVHTTLYRACMSCLANTNTVSSFPLILHYKIFPTKIPSNLEIFVKRIYSQLLYVHLISYTVYLLHF